jgi:hypothetical protein
MTRSTRAREGRPVRRVIETALIGALMVAAQGGAEIAVFTDGRVMKVADAFLEGDCIVLVLPSSGRIEVPATRIDRVVADEIAVTAAPAGTGIESCDASWREESLPAHLPYALAIEAAAQREDLNPRLLAALVETESGFNPWAVSRAGAAGLTQLMPAAAADHQVEDPFNPDESLRGGAEHLRALLDRFEENLPLALAAYNAGSSTVDRYQGIPPYRETQDYVSRIMDAFCSDQNPVATPRDDSTQGRPHESPDAEPGG